jgi:serine protease Do
MSHGKPPRLLFCLSACMSLAFTDCRAESVARTLPEGSTAASSAGASAAGASAAAASTAPPQTAQAAPEAGHGADFRTIFSRLSKRVVPSVVSITTERTVAAPQNPFDFFGEEGSPFEFFFGEPGQGQGGGRQRPAQPRQRKESGLGSGFVAGDGYILTNNHVVEGAQKLKVQLADERTFDAEVVGTDKPTDLAVIKFKGKPPAGLVPLPFGDSDKLDIGEWVVAVGAPFGLYESVTTGIISAKGRQNTGITAYGNFLQTDAAINPGNSGGPLLNLDGAVIGINTAIFSQSGGYMGIGFAIPVNLARNVMDNLVKHGKVTRGWLGVSIQNITPDMADALGLKERKGALIGDVLPGGPAEKAGLKRGDVVISLMGRDVADANDLMNRVALIPPGATADLAVIRDGRTEKFKIKVDKRNEEKLAETTPGGREGGARENPGADVASLGLTVSALTDAVREAFRLGKDPKEGVAITGIDPAGAAAEAGLQEGDVILEAGRKRVASPADLAQTARKPAKGKGLLLLAYRDGSTFYVTVTPRT